MAKRAGWLVPLVLLVFLTSPRSTPGREAAGPFDDRPAAYQALIGVNTGTIWYDDGTSEGPGRILDRLQDNGVRHTRETLSWGHIGTDPRSRSDPARLELSGFDDVMEQAAVNNVEVLPMLEGSPEWANDTPGRPGEDSYCRPPEGEHYDEFADFAVAVVDRYREGGDFWDEFDTEYPDDEFPDLEHQPVTAIEVWNEPYLGWNWSFCDNDAIPVAAEFAELALAAVRAVESAFPDVATVVPIKQERPTGFTGAVWSCDLFQAGNPVVRPCTDGPGAFDRGPVWDELADLTDVWAVHPYEESSHQVAGDLEYEFQEPHGEVAVDGWTEDHLSSALDMRDQLSQYGGVDDPRLWATEFGWSTQLGSPSLQAEYTVRSLRYINGNWPWLERVYLYSYKEPPDRNGGEDWSLRNDDADTTDKPAWAAIGRLLGDRPAPAFSWPLP